MSTVWDQLLPDVLPYAPGAPRSMAAVALHAAAATLCDQGLIWRVELPAMDVNADQPLYDLAAPAGAELSLVLSVRIDQAKLAPAVDEDLDREFPGWRALEGARSTRFLVQHPRSIRLVPIPTEDRPAGMTVQAALKPSRPGTIPQPDQEVVDWLCTVWRDVLCSGALARLLRMPHKEWTDPQAGLVEERRFLNGLVRAKNERLKGATTASRAVQPRSFGA